MGLILGPSGQPALNVPGSTRISFMPIELVTVFSVGFSAGTPSNFCWTVSSTIGPFTGEPLSLLAQPESGSPTAVNNADRPARRTNRDTGGMETLDSSGAKGGASQTGKTLTAQQVVGRGVH